MKSVTRYQTFDGQEHKDQKAATRHLDKIENEILTRHSLAIKKLIPGDYHQIGNYLSAAALDIARLVDIESDRNTEGEED